MASPLNQTHLARALYHAVGTSIRARQACRLTPATASPQERAALAEDAHRALSKVQSLSAQRAANLKRPRRRRR
jgi:hypothetical protein